MVTGDWIVERVDRTDDIRYPFRVIGRLRETGELFRWCVPSVASKRYDLRLAEMDQKTRAAVDVARYQPEAQQ